MLLGGINHVAVLTADTDRLLAFYDEIFEAPAESLQDQPGFRVSMVLLGPWAELNVFQIDGNEEHAKQVPMFGRRPTGSPCASSRLDRSIRRDPAAPH